MLRAGLADGVASGYAHAAEEVIPLHEQVDSLWTGTPGAGDAKTEAIRSALGSVQMVVVMTSAQEDEDVRDHAGENASDPGDWGRRADVRV